MKLAVSGCPRNCAESYVKDVGIVAIEGGRWEIYVGGAAGAHIRKGDLLATVDDAETAKLLTGRFLQYYRENAKWLERTYAFVPRVGLEHIRAVVVDDSEGIAERLDAAVQEHADALRRPLDPGRATRSPRASSAPRCRWRCCRRCRPTGPSSCWAVPGDRGRPTAAPCSVRSTRSRSARAGPSPSAASRSPSSGCATAACAPCRRSARTRAGRSPTARSTTAIVLCPLHLNAFELDTGCSPTGAPTAPPLRRDTSSTTARSSSSPDPRTLKEHDHDQLSHTTTSVGTSTRTRRRLGGHWIDDWRPEDGEFWETTRARPSPGAT